MKFEITEEVNTHQGNVVYNINDQSFNYTPMLSADISIFVNYLSIEIDSESMHVKYVWGLSPQNTWSYKELVKPMAVRKNLKVSGQIEPGFSYRLDGDIRWESYFDKSSGWYCIEKPHDKENQVCVEFANDSLAVICDGELIAIWLQPKFV